MSRDSLDRDLLEEAVQALRDSERDGSSEDAGHRFTRARVMASLHQGTVRRRTRLAFVLPLAATFVAASAWGVSSGRAHRVLEQFGVKVDWLPQAVQDPPADKKPASRPRSPSLAPAAPVAPTAAAPASTAPAATATAIASTPVVAPAPASAPAPAPATVAGSAALPTRSGAAPSSSRPAGAASAAAQEADIELDLYRIAHRAHFSERDSRSALAAWNAYLGQAPNGRFALEARYNRALCLVRLGRNAEARAALEPFAAGKFGSYRTREAKELLEALPE